MHGSESLVHYNDNDCAVCALTSSVFLKEVSRSHARCRLAYGWLYSPSSCSQKNNVVGKIKPRCDWISVIHTDKELYDALFCAFMWHVDKRTDRPTDIYREHNPHAFTEGVLTNLYIHV